MQNVKIPLLEASDIKVRAQRTKPLDGGKTGATLLLYKDSRVDMRILDEVFGLYGWQCEFTRLGSELYCSIKVRDPETGEWITKTNVGTPSNAEKEKGEASDALKRAGFMVGIGRELYTAPFIYVTLGKGEYANEFSVYDIYYDEIRREIIALRLCDKTGRIRFAWKKQMPKKEAAHE